MTRGPDAARSLRFGTDGVRGRVPEDLSADDVRRIGAAAADVLGGPRFYVGRDTRASGAELEQALLDGLGARGVEGVRLGVVPTPVVAWLAAADDLPGAVISASHNPARDNGVKLFARGGVKLSDALQDQVQARLDATPAGPLAPEDDAVAAVAADEADVARYRASIESSIDGRDLRGLQVVVDCANGAASHVAPATLRALGAELHVLHATPDGRNINDDCGSTYPASLQRAVVERGAHVGLAFDGDADRVLAVDADGALVDGDQIVAICAIDRHERGCLPGDAVVVTVMTNLGFRLSMQQRGIEVVETAVGDRHVLEALEARGLSLGGEQSGHVVFRDLATTGDGLLTGVQLLDVMRRTGRSLRALAADAMERLPQVLHNVRIDARRHDLTDRLRPDIAAVEATLGARGRVLVRPSGTEPVVRVMVEAASRTDAERAAATLVAAVQRLSEPPGGAGVEP
jgi:phosphoglucosamine mutase